MIGSFKNSLESENRPAAAGPLRCGWKCGDYWVNFLHYPRVTHIFGPSAFGDVELAMATRSREFEKKILIFISQIKITLLIYIIKKILLKRLFVILIKRKGILIITRE